MCRRMQSPLPELPPLSRTGSCFRSLLCALALSPLVALSAHANSGVSDERVSLPDGPGSIGGVGENLSASDNMGAMGYSVELTLPEGFSDATPSLALRYSSLSGNERVGIGWELSGAPHIERLTLRGVPGYTKEDAFAADGSDELVPVQAPSGLRRYRSRFEGSLVRYTWHADEQGQAGYWEAEYPDGSRGFFGAGQEGQPVASALARHPDGGVFRYHLVERVSSVGHRIRYHYSHGEGAHAANTPLLTRIEYLFKDGAPRFAVQLHYAERKDGLSNGLPGFALHLKARLVAVEVFSKDILIRRTQLEYEEALAGTSRLLAVHRFGLRSVPYPASFAFEYSPSLDTKCTDCLKPKVSSLGRLRASASGGLNPENGRSTLIDLNGDALPDILQTGINGEHYFYFNELDPTQGPHFSAAQRSARATQGLVLSEPGVQVADLNGDGFADLFRSTDGRVFCNLGNGDWEPDGTACGTVGGGVGDIFQDDGDPGDGDVDPQGLRFADLNGDRRIDLLRTVSEDSTQVWLNTEQGFVLQPVAESLGRVFDPGALQLADLNGDGLLDAVEVQDDGRVWQRLHLGLGRWSPAKLEPLRDVPAVPNLARVTELQDLNGDGQDDLVIVQGSTVYYALRQAEGFLPFASVTSQDVDGELPINDNDTSVLYADMNGSGTTDVVWLHAPSGQMHMLELFDVRPNLLVRTDNGLGGVQRVEYESSVLQQVRDRQRGLAWQYKLPQAVTVVRAIERYATLSPHVALRVERSYSHGYYDGRLLLFRQV